MPALAIGLDATRLTARLDRMTPDVKAALRNALGPLAHSIAADARDLAAAHIRHLGKTPGQYLASIEGGVSVKGERVVGYVRSGDPLAHLLESGARIPAHEILPSAADVLAFMGGSAEVFAKVVHSPGATVPPYPAIEPAFTAAQSTIVDTLTGAVRSALAK